MPPAGDVARNPGMCPDWESNPWPFGSQVGTQSTEPHQPGLIYSFNLNISSEMSYGVPECDIVMLQNYMLMIW